MDANGDVLKDENDKPKAAHSVAELASFIEAQNRLFETRTDSDPAMVVTFKVMPIPYTIDYGVGVLIDNGSEFRNIGKVILEDTSTLQGVMQAALNALEGGDVRIAVPDNKNPEDYDVSYFRNQGSFTLKTPVYVQNPEKTDVIEYWKFTGWSLGENTTANTRAVAGEYPSLEVDHAVGNLIFLANWERVPASLTVTNRVTTESGVKIPDEDFEYTITLPSGVNVADLPIYKTDADGNVTKFDLPADGRFTLKNGETISIAGLTGAYTVTQTITGDKFDSTKEKYYTYTGATIDNGSAGVNHNVAGATLGGVNNPFDAVIFNNVYVATVDLDTDPGATGNQGFPVTKYLLEKNAQGEYERRNFFGGNTYTFLIRAGAQSAPGIDTPVPNPSVILPSTAGVSSLSGNFDSVRYTQPGTYTYVINEERPTIGVPGVSYDSTMYRITVEVSVSANGEDLVVTITNVETRTTADTSGGGTSGWTPVRGGATDLEGNIVFENTYNTTEVNRTFQPTKVLEGREEALKPGDFTFTLMPAGSYVMDQTAAEAYHNAISDIDKLGFLRRIDRQFTEDSAQPMPGNVTSENKVQNGESGAILISPITYTSEHMGGNAYGKIYKYTLKEDVPAGAVDGKANGIVYDTETRTLYVYVHLHKTDGTLATLTDTDTLVYADVLGDRNATFTNRYETTPVEVDFGDSDKNDNDDVDIALIKRITGRNFETGDSFTFTLAPATQNAPMPVNAAGAEVKEVTVRPDSGSSVEIPFGKITFEKAGVYTYTLREKTGNLAGMAYDTEDREVTVTVTDNGRGQLTAVVNPESVTWINRYNSVDVDLGDSDKNDNDDVNVGLVKRIRGRRFQAGDSFTFTLTPVTLDAPMPKDATGTEVNEVTVTPTSGSSVEIPFGKITFEEAGVYIYTLQENTGDLDKMTYDDGAKTITITVTENENGQLTAVADPGSVTWTNKYRTSGSKPDPDKKPGNDSGDSGSGGSGSDSGGSGGSGDTANAASGSEAALASAGGSALPQTGMLWWPVWILVIIGAVMLGVGIVRKKTSRGSHEE